VDGVIMEVTMAVAVIMAADMVIGNRKRMSF
jgi:hypothetical protein